MQRLWKPSANKRKRAKLWLTIVYAAWFVVSLWWLKLLLLGIAVAVTIHVIAIRTLKPAARNPRLLAEYESPEDLP